MKRIIATSDAPAAVGPYSQAVAVGGMLFCAGQIPLDPATGEMVSGDVAAQTERVCANVAAVLQANGMTFANVVKTTVFLTDNGQLQRDERRLCEAFHGAFPRPLDRGRGRITARIGSRNRSHRDERRRMTDHELLDLFRETHALLEGHFVLRSGLHSRQFFQCALLLQHTTIAARVCGALAEKLRGIAAERVISPALGGIIVGHEIARALGKPHIFVEKENNALVLRRGFEIRKGDTFIVAEDVVTRGGRVQETINIVRAHGGRSPRCRARRSQRRPTAGLWLPLHCTDSTQRGNLRAGNLPPDSRSHAGSEAWVEIARSGTGR
jgi:orotate phosphoribosyltransferase